VLPIVSQDPGLFETLLEHGSENRSNEVIEQSGLPFKMRSPVHSGIDKTDSITQPDLLFHDRSLSPFLVSHLANCAVEQPGQKTTPSSVEGSPSKTERLEQLGFVVPKVTLTSQLLQCETSHMLEGFLSFFLESSPFEG